MNDRTEIKPANEMADAKQSYKDAYIAEHGEIAANFHFANEEIRSCVARAIAMYKALSDDYAAQHADALTFSRGVSPELPWGVLVDYADALDERFKNAAYSTLYRAALYDYHFTITGVNIYDAMVVEHAARQARLSDQNDSAHYRQPMLRAFGGVRA